MKQFPVAKRTLSHFKSIDPDPSPWHWSKNPLMISNLVAYEAKIYNRKHKKHRTFLKGHCDNSFAVSKSWLIDLKRNSIPCEPKGNIKSILSKNSSVLKFWRFLESCHSQTWKCWPFFSSRAVDDRNWIQPTKLL